MTTTTDKIQHIISEEKEWYVAYQTSAAEGLGALKIGKWAPR